MSLSNFQDVVVLSSDTLLVNAERIVLGSSAGSKSIVFAQDVALASAMHLVASNPTAARTAILADAAGTLGYLTAISANGGAVTNGQLVFSNSSEIVFGVNGNTLTMGLTTISALQFGIEGDVRGFQVSGTQTLASSAGGNSTSFSAESVSAIHVVAEYPLNATYIDPKAQISPEIFITGSISATGSITVGVTEVWWCGLYTISASTAGVVSSISATATQSVSSVTGFNVATTGILDRRFSTNLTWNITPGDYMFFSGYQMSVSVSASSHSGVTATQVFTFDAAGVTQRQVSYSVPYWAGGSASQSATSYHLSDLQNSGGTGATLMAWYAHMIGS